VCQRCAQRQQSLSLPQQLTDPDSLVVTEAITRRCDQCRAPIGELCTKRGGFRADLLGRLIHLGRMRDA